MGFADKPYEKQAIAVETAQTTEELVRIIHEAHDINIKRMAVGKIDDQDTLAQIACQVTPSPTADDVLASIMGEYVPAVDSYFDNNAVRLAAIAKINDPAVRTELALNDPEPSMRILAIMGGMLDQTVLETIAINDGNSEVRETAVRSIRDHGVLRKVALGDPDRDVRLAAVCKIKDPETLLDVVNNDAFPDGRAAAAIRIADQAILATIAKGHEDFEVRAAAASLIDDQATLAGIALGDPHGEVRKAAARNITDQLSLARIIEQEPDYSIWRPLVYRITDKAILARLALNEQKSVRRAIGKRIMKLND